MQPQAEINLNNLCHNLDIIRYTVGDAKIIVADTGWVVPAESPELLADAVEEASVEMKNQALWSKRQNRCRERIEENYSLERMISAYRTVWKEVVSE